MHDLPDRRFTKIDEPTRAKILRLYRDQKMPIRLIQERLRISRGAIKRVLADAGVPLRGGRGVEFDREP
jgi:DNA-binding transcriptional ArsR family regulator